jgi:hypothetical protein
VKRRYLAAALGALAGLALAAPSVPAATYTRAASAHVAAPAVRASDDGGGMTFTKLDAALIVGGSATLLGAGLAARVVARRRT